MKQNAARLVSMVSGFSCSKAKRLISLGSVAFNNVIIQDISSELEVRPSDMIRIIQKEEMVIKDCGEEIFCCATCEVAKTFAKQKEEAGFDASIIGNMVFVYKKS